MKEEKKQSNKSPKKKEEEHLTRKELEELMGVHMDTYTKKNGAWRRK